MTTAITRSVRTRMCIINRRTGPGRIYTADPFTRRGGISSWTSSWTSTLCATSSAHGHHFCVVDGRSNKIGTSDNFRLRVISLSCPVEAARVRSSSPFYFLSSSPLHYLPIYLLHLSFYFFLPLSCSSPCTVAAHRSLHSPGSAREDDDHYFKIAPNIDAKKCISHFAVARLQAHPSRYGFQLIASPIVFASSSPRICARQFARVHTCAYLNR